jgi:hypothetical protein
VKRVAFICLAIFALNAVICAPLFRIEYLDDFQSNEGSYITFGKFLLTKWPHVAWFPWFNAGLPFEDTYLPGVGILVALAAWIARCSPAHAFHLVAALAYSLAPVFLFLFARALSGRVAASAWGAALWSLLSPSVLFPQLLEDMGTPWGLRRLQNIVAYGETPHNLALCLLPVSLWMTLRMLERPTARRFAIAALAAAAVMLTNAFGIVVVSVSSLILFAVRKELRVKSLVLTGGMLAAAYLAICRFLTPTVARLLETNSQLVGGDYRFTGRSFIPAGVFVALLLAIWAIARRYASPMIQFAALFSACFGGIVFLSFHGVNLMPQPVRYHIEMEAGLCLLAAFLIERATRGLPRRIALAAGLVCIAALAWVAVKDYRFARRLIRPADIVHSTPYMEARWIAANLPGERVMVAAEGQWWFNLFADNPQMGAGHEPTAPNWMQRVAVYTIYSGANAGAQDAAISILWLKVFGCGAIVVPGPSSRDAYHAVVHPEKFDGVLPVVWRADGESIYRVPLRSTSLAHVVPRANIVTRRPIHGLDVDPVRPYLAALDDPAIPAAELNWKDPDEGTVEAKMSPSDVVSVQITYDPGWRARVGGKPVPLRADALGFIEIDPQCVGACSIDLDFNGGLERETALAISLITVAALLGMLIWKQVEPA